MRKRIILLAMFLGVAFLSGCATVMTGPTQKVPVTSNPSGAVAKVDGSITAITPAIFTLERKTDHTIEITKDGFRTATVIIRHTMSGATAGNILIGGIIGVAVDGATGAMFKLIPERVDVTLEPEVSSSPVTPVSAQVVPVATSESNIPAPESKSIETNKE